MKKLKTKDKILDAALNIVSKEGIDQLSVTRVSKSTGLSKSLILYHFESNEKIVSSLFSQMSKVGQAYTIKSLENKSNILEQISAIATGAYSWIVNHQDYAEFFALMYHLSSKNKELHKVHLQTLVTGLERLEYLLLKSPGICNVKEAPLLAKAIQNLLIGYCLRSISTQLEKNLKEDLESLKFGLERLLGESIPSIKIIKKIKFE